MLPRWVYIKYKCSVTLYIISRRVREFQYYLCDKNSLILLLVTNIQVLYRLRFIFMFTHKKKYI